MESVPVFTIGIPVYKGQHLKECIESILAQSYSQLELIILNDGSPDKIEEIVSYFKDERIKYFVNAQNVGAERLVLNWNELLNKACGKFFILMGDDDMMEFDYLEVFLELIQKKPQHDVYHCRSKIIDGNSVPMALTPSWPDYETVYDNMWHKMFTNRICFISDYVYRTDALKAKGGFFYLPMAWASDDITAYLAIGNKGIAHINKPLLNYRKHSKTLSSSGDSELKMRAIIEKQNWMMDFLSREPFEEDDLVVYQDIRRRFPYQIKKEKIFILCSSFNSSVIRNFSYWVRNRKRYTITLNYIFIAVIMQVKCRLFSSNEQ